MHLPEFDVCPLCIWPCGPQALDASNSVRVRWICLISIEKVNVHLLTSNQ